MIEKIGEREISVLCNILKDIVSVSDMKKKVPKATSPELKYKVQKKISENEVSERTMRKGVRILKKRGFIKNVEGAGKKSEYILIVDEVPRLIKEIVNYVKNFGFDDISGTKTAEMIFKEILPILNNLDRIEDGINWWMTPHSGHVDFYKNQEIIKFLCDLYTSEFFRYKPVKEYEEVFRKIKKEFVSSMLEKFGKKEHDQEMFDNLVKQGLHPNS